MRFCTFGLERKVSFVVLLLRFVVGMRMQLLLNVYVAIVVFAILTQLAKVARLKHAQNIPKVRYVFLNYIVILEIFAVERNRKN